MNKKELMYKKIEEHGENLKRVFSLPDDTDPIKLCKRLKRLENKAHHATTCLCNTNTLHLLELNRFTGYDVEQTSEDDQDIFFTKIRSSVLKLLDGNNPGMLSSIFINYDPRGYALKIRSDAVINERIYKDWGGYVIIAPDFSE